jgi:hypothetical protein
MTAAEYHRMVVSTLTQNGWDCQVEVEVPSHSGRRGFIDIVARKGLRTVGIELDRSSPRDNSVFKLKQLRATHRFVVLREPLHNGIYALGVVTVLSGLNELLEQLERKPA